VHHAGCTFRGFSQPDGAAVVLGERVLGTFTRCSFMSNTAISPSAAAPPGHGPALNLRSGSETSSYSAVWLQGCTFVDNIAETRGAASVSNQFCRVFSDSPDVPEVFVASSAHTESPWQLVPADDPSARADKGFISSGRGLPGFHMLDFPTGSSRVMRDALAVRSPQLPLCSCSSVQVIKCRGRLADV
jgi:hypothetical protein